jgi:endonuclease/exonuclease/phosphatase family metal-dependent hydrolase
MSQRVMVGVCTVVSVFAVLAVLAAPSLADAQTTVVLDAPGTDVVDTTIRGGSYASTNFDDDVLVTRSSIYDENTRRALLKFDTDSRIPARARIESATLTLTIKRANGASAVAVYRVADSFDASTATWEKRKDGYTWRGGGGDFGAKYAETVAKAGAGSKVTFDITDLVQDAVNGADSRWTRLALIDRGEESSLSYREYYSSEASGTSVRPVLAVTYTSGGSSPVPSSSALPAGWAATDIGSVAKKGATVFAGTTLAVTATGADIWDSSDELHFAYRALHGDGSIETRVDSVDAVDRWTKAGVMMRETLAPTARHAFMLVSGGHGLAFQRRTAPAGSSDHTDGGAGAAPYFVKLDRTGDVFSAFKSKDGSSWTLVGRSTIGMADTIYVGVAVTSHSDGVHAKATFAAAAVRDGAAPPPDDKEDPRPSPPPPPRTPPSPENPTNAKELKLLHWNVQHGGVGTDGRYDPNRVASWIAKINPDVASLNEVDTLEQVNAIISALRASTGVTWRASYSGLGNLVVSRLPLVSTSKCPYDPSMPHIYAAHASVVVNGRPVNVFSAHLHVSSARARLTEAKALQACASGWAEARIIAGDYNMQYGTAEYIAAATGYSDAWLAVKALGKAINFSGNCDGCTRNSRIDYVFTSKAASWLSVKSVQIVDTRNSKGVRASDHKPMLVVYDVR